jgi:hypothetical protein
MPDRFAEIRVSSLDAAVGRRASKVKKITLRSARELLSTRAAEWFELV